MTLSARGQDFTRSIFQSLTGVGYGTSCDTAAISMLDVFAIVELLTCYTKICRVTILTLMRIFTVLGRLLLLGCSSGLTASAGAIVSCLCLAGACSGFCSSDLVRMPCLSIGNIVTGRFTGGQHVDRTHKICSHCVQESLADELHVVHECPLL